MILSARRAFILACQVGCVIAPLAVFGASVAATPEARQFDFLVGQWQVSGEVKVSGLMALVHGQPKLAGSWKAWRTADGQGIEDELTLTDASGTPRSAVHFTRSFSREDNCWNITGRDAYNGAPTAATARQQGNEMLMTSSGTTPEGKHYRNRTHYLAITPVGFRMVQDRSYDEGKTWDTGAVTLDVRRTGH
ncbi:MAG: hypothetical protein JWQ01_108 [Massilia sp.]|nr:hypothetical protein [Massilia sp.]